MLLLLVSPGGIAVVPFGEKENGKVCTGPSLPSLFPTRNSNVCQPLLLPGPRYNVYEARRLLSALPLLEVNCGSGRFVWPCVELGITPSMTSCHDCRRFAANETMPSASKNSPL